MLSADFLVRIVLLGKISEFYSKNSSSTKRFFVIEITFFSFFRLFLFLIFYIFSIFRISRFSPSVCKPFRFFPRQYMLDNFFTNNIVSTWNYNFYIIFFYNPGCPALDSIFLTPRVISRPGLHALISSTW